MSAKQNYEDDDDDDGQTLHHLYGFWVASCVINHYDFFYFKFYTSLDMSIKFILLWWDYDACDSPICLKQKKMMELNHLE